MSNTLLKLDSSPSSGIPKLLESICTTLKTCFRLVYMRTFKNKIITKKILLFLLLIIISSQINATSFTQEIWNENRTLYQQIFDLPFNQKLLGGTLDEKIFKNYIIQDYFYLQNEQKVFAILLARAPDKNSAKFLVNSITAVDEEINDIHKKFFKKFHITEQDLQQAALYPITEFYNSFLIKTALLEPFEVSLMATLPCSWLYYKIGVDMKHFKQVKSNKYQAWIDGYGAVSWEKSDTKIFVNLLEQYWLATTPRNREKMRQIFKIAMMLEYMFWNDIYQNSRWPATLQ